MSYFALRSLTAECTSPYFFKEHHKDTHIFITDMSYIFHITSLSNTVETQTPSRADDVNS